MGFLARNARQQKRRACRKFSVIDVRFVEDSSPATTYSRSSIFDVLGATNVPLHESKVRSRIEPAEFAGLSGAARIFFTAFRVISRAVIQPFCPNKKGRRITPALALRDVITQMGDAGQAR
jgi:hypothetical protein